MRHIWVILAIGLILTAAGQCHAESANVTIPGAIYFNVINVSVDTFSAPQTVSVTDIDMGEGKRLKIGIKAIDSGFFRVGSGAFHRSWCSWNAPAWTGGTGSVGNFMNNAVYNDVAVSDINATTLETTALVFKIGAGGTEILTRAGDYILSASWSFSSL